MKNTYFIKAHGEKKIYPFFIKVNRTVLYFLFMKKKMACLNCTRKIIKQPSRSLITKSTFSLTASS